MILPSSSLKQIFNCPVYTTKYIQRIVSKFRSGSKLRETSPGSCPRVQSPGLCFKVRGPGSYLKVWDSRSCLKVRGPGSCLRVQGPGFCFRVWNPGSCLRVQGPFFTVCHFRQPNDPSSNNTLFFINDTFISNARLKLVKNQAYAKHLP